MQFVHTSKLPSHPTARHEARFDRPGSLFLNARSIAQLIDSIQSVECGVPQECGGVWLIFFHKYHVMKKGGTGQREGVRASRDLEQKWTQCFDMRGMQQQDPSALCIGGVFQVRRNHLDFFVICWAHGPFVACPMEHTTAQTYQHYNPTLYPSLPPEGGLHVGKGCFQRSPGISTDAGGRLLIQCSLFVNYKAPEM